MQNQRTPLRRRTYNAILLVLFVVLQLLVIGIAFMGGFLFSEWRWGKPEQVGPSSPLPQILPSRPEFGLLSEAYKLLKDNAYFPLPDGKLLEYGMIRGMLQAYNEPFTSFVDPPQAELQTNELEGKFGGIGVRIERDGKKDVYLYPLPDSPAIKAGVQDGDRLLKVEEMAIDADTPTDDIQAAVRGPVGQKVTITIGHRPAFLPVEVSVERAEVALPSVTWNLSPDNATVGVVQVRVMADTTPNEVSHAIEDLQSRGATRFLIDLRNNGGGLVDAGVNTARLFLKSGTVIEEQYRGQPVKVYKVEKPGPFADLPVVFMVNRGTASAAEIVTGAIKGQKRAPLVGVRTYGKDTIQLVFSLSDRSSLHVTAAHWWVPGLEPKIGQNGVQPDVALPDDAGDAQMMAKAIETVLNLSK